MRDVRPEAMMARRQKMKKTERLEETQYEDGEARYGYQYRREKRSCLAQRRQVIICIFSFIRKEEDSGKLHASRVSVRPRVPVNHSSPSFESFLLLLLLLLLLLRIRTHSKGKRNSKRKGKNGTAEQEAEMGKATVAGEGREGEREFLFNASLPSQASIFSC